VTAVSTAWNALRHESGKEVIQELQALGFSSFELNVHLTEGMLREIEEMLAEIEVVTLHNYCPVREGPRSEWHGDFYFLSSPDPTERRKAVDGTLQTVEWARRFRARAVVLHLGRVVMEHHHQEILDLRLAGRHKEADDILRRDLEARESIKEPYLEAALTSLSELAREVGGDVLLGVETRVVYHEIPSFDEVALALEAIPPSAGGYWHDFGHAHILELIGAAKHDDFLAKYSDRLIGMHIHDAFRRQDHHALTQGTIDFRRLLPMVPKDAIDVLEIHPYASACDLAKSREIWNSLFRGTCPAWERHRNQR